MNGLGDALAGTLVCLALGVPLVILGFYALDAIVPGRLGHLIMGDDGSEPSINAGVLAAANLLGSALIVFTAVWSNYSANVPLGVVAVWTLVFGAIGIAARVAALKLVDVATPGHLTAVVVAHRTLHPAALFAAAADLAMSLIVVAAIA